MWHEKDAERKAQRVLHRFDEIDVPKPRKKLAVKLQNPRLMNINFHSFRHWKATKLCH